MILLDTSILLRFPDTQSPDRPAVLSAIAKLLRSQENLVIVPQNIYEFWTAATRRPGSPQSGGQNGLGMTLERATLWLTRLQNLCRVLPDAPDILPIWQKLIISHRVTGYRAHDLRLVAAMTAHGIPRILTLNLRHFTGRGVTVVDPKSL
jgi:predicted nucleic acid-binding protein